mmetsp:Transcript_110861/g.357703  ORF Transcript_110861/g.357703 Transcript_110861/m.357703 type:complete len:418 (+) Transcript_110861:79-1332(+)
MQTDGPHPKAPSPRPQLRQPFGGIRSFLSFSSAETVTPESGAGGWPSRASADGGGVDGLAVGGLLSRAISPGSQPSLADLGESLNSCGIKHLTAAQRLDELSTSAGTTNASARRGCSKRCAGRHGAVLGRRLRKGGLRSTLRLHAGDFRRRKYAAPKGHPRPESSSGFVPSRRDSASKESGSFDMPLSAGGISASSSRGTCGSDAPGGTHTKVRCSNLPCSKQEFQGSDSPDCEVLVEGPLQQRVLFFLWRWRWCVLTCQELRIYVDEEASLLTPERPIERHPASKISAAPDLHFPSVLVCTDQGSGEPFTYLRTGPGLRWEEVAAASLWLRAFASSSRRERGSRPAPRGASTVSALASDYAEGSPSGASAQGVRGRGQGQPEEPAEEPQANAPGATLGSGSAVVRQQADPPADCQG